MNCCMPSIVIYVFIYDISSFVVLVVSFQYSQTKGKMYCLIVQWQDWIFTLMAGRSLCGGLHEVGALVSYFETHTSSRCHVHQ